MKHLLLFISLAFLLQSCIKDEVISSGPVDISFSLDTLHFDTVFTQVGSATRSVKIFNHEDEDVILSRVYLEKLGESKFRLNVDGLDGESITDVRIGAKDSIYAFLEVTIDPDQPLSVSPFVIEEYLIVEVDEFKTSLLIDAWGQNANYIPSRFNRGQVHRLDCDDVAWWDDPKPYVIYGLLYIDSCVLNVVGGTQIYVHGGVARTVDTSGNTRFINDGNIVIGPSGRLVTIGTPNNPVVFQGDRLERAFESIPGQWGGIRLLPGSRGTNLTGAIIRNAIFGVYADSLSEVTINKTQIVNTSSAGIIAFHAGDVHVSNSLIHSNGANSVVLSFGGKHRFEYTTMANFGNDREALFMSNHFCYDFPQCENWPVNDLEASFINCIATGSNKDEVWVSFRDEAMADVQFDHCLIRIEELLDTDNIPDFMSRYTSDCINRMRSDSLFADVSNGDFRPDTLSVIENRARPILQILTDIENNVRDGLTPDMGCYEYQY